MMHRHEAVEQIRASRFGSLDEAKQFGSGISIPGVIVSVREDQDLGQYIFTFQGPGANTETVQTPTSADGQPGPVQQPDGSAPLAGSGARASTADARPPEERRLETAMAGGDVVSVGPDGGQSQQTGVSATLQSPATAGGTGTAAPATAASGTTSGSDASGDDYEAMTVEELKTELDNRGIEYSSSDRKADLIEKLENAE